MAPIAIWSLRDCTRNPWSAFAKFTRNSAAASGWSRILTQITGAPEAPAPSGPPGFSSVRPSQRCAADREAGLGTLPPHLDGQGYSPRSLVHLKHRLPAARPVSVRCGLPSVALPTVRPGSQHDITRESNRETPTLVSAGSPAPSRLSRVSKWQCRPVQGRCQEAGRRLRYPRARRLPPSKPPNRRIPTPRSAKGLRRRGPR
jgi:hypothetical protein